MKLKEVMEKERLNWRSFDERSGIIASWNHPVTPGYYLLDRNGVIRHKWAGYPGERALDAALEQLIRAAEGNESGGPVPGQLRADHSW